MIYRAIGLMSGSSMDGLDIVFTELNYTGGRWTYEILASACMPYDEEWKHKLANASALNARDYLLLHSAYGHYLGKEVNRFIDEHGLHYKVGLIASHGHTSFHLPGQGMTAQLGDGAAIAAETGLPVVSDLRALDVAFGGQGAPIVPVGEQLLFEGHQLFLNLGGIANISFSSPDGYLAFDICAANRVLNTLAGSRGLDYDEDGKLASVGTVNESLLNELNAFSYYRQPFPKSLANEFGLNEVLPLIEAAGLSPEDSLRTYVAHIVFQISEAIRSLPHPVDGSSMLVTGGGAFNSFLMNELSTTLAILGVQVVVPHQTVVAYKEAIVMALIGVLRWRQEYNVLSSVTGASRNSIGGAVWIGQEA